MDTETPQEYIDGLSDADLMAAATQANDDLRVAARNQPESEWHQACFAGVIMFGMEMEKRGLTLATAH